MPLHEQDKRNAEHIGIVPTRLPRRDVRFMLELLKRGKDYFIITSSCMIENVPRGQRATWSHWQQDEKNADMVALAKDYAPFAFQTKDRRTALRYASILKHYKKELAK